MINICKRAAMLSVVILVLTAAIESSRLRNLAGTPGAPPDSGVDQVALDRHNLYRSSHQVAPLSWSSDAAQAALVRTAGLKCACTVCVSVCVEVWGAWPVLCVVL